MLFDICYSILLLDIGYIISNTWYLTPWYLQSKTLIQATCYLPNVHWYLILFTWYQSLLLLAKVVWIKSVVKKELKVQILGSKLCCPIIFGVWKFWVHINFWSKKSFWSKNLFSANLCLKFCQRYAKENGKNFPKKIANLLIRPNQPTFKDWLCSDQKQCRHSQKYCQDQLP